MGRYNPEQVKHVRSSNLAMPQVKTMLEFLGVPLRMQPKSRGDKDRLLTEKIAGDPIKAQSAYEVIVLNKLPEVAKAAQDDIDKVRAHFTRLIADALADSNLEVLHEGIRKTVDEAGRGMEKRMEQAALKAINEAAEKHRPVVIKMGSAKPKRVKGVLPKEYERIVQLASQRIPVMMVGPAGCGKTYIAAKVAEALEYTVGPKKGKSLAFYDQSCSAGVSESIFTGWLLPVEKGGSFDYVASPFITAYENGGAFLLDEMDASDPNMLTFLNKAIANDSFYLPQRHKNPLVKKHPDFVVLAAANTFGKGADAEYVGRNALDAATLDRFRAGMVHMDYSAEVEGTLVHPDVLTWGLAVRKFIYANRLRRIMSTRVLLDMTKMTENCGWGKDDWEAAFFADWSRDEMDRWRKAQADAALAFQTAQTQAGADQYIKTAQAQGAAQGSVR